MKRIREIFLTQYIGAIVIGMLVVQAIAGFISLLMQPLIWYTQARESRSAMQFALPFPWSQLLPSAITIALYVVVSYLLFAWLYQTEEGRLAAGEAEKTASRSD
jgi:ABC-type antimicrobial peptide transport system permease subunit